MTVSGARPDRVAFPAAAGLRDLETGEQIHAAAVKFGYGSSSVTVAYTLVNLYGKCSSIGGARNVFDRITERDQVSWNSYIATLCRIEMWE